MFESPNNVSINCVRTAQQRSLLPWNLCFSVSILDLKLILFLCMYPGFCTERLPALVCHRKAVDIASATSSFPRFYKCLFFFPMLWIKPRNTCSAGVCPGATRTFSILLLVWFFVCFFWDKVSLCHFGQPGTHYAGHSGLELTEFKLTWLCLLGAEIEGITTPSHKHS